MSKTTIDQAYLHVCNSGLTMAVEDHGKGPELVISTSAFGNLNHSLRTFTNAETLRALGQMLIKASEHPGYSEVYCHQAVLQDLSSNEHVLGENHAVGGSEGGPQS